MTRDISLASHRIGRHHPPFIIAEMSGNHNQPLDRALAIVEAAASPADTTEGWWYVRFRLKWPEGEEPILVSRFKALNELWRNQGGHALLHHLSAVFGYQELMVTRRELMRF